MKFPEGVFFGRMRLIDRRIRDRDIMLLFDELGKSFLHCLEDPCPKLGILLLRQDVMTLCPKIFLDVFLQRSTPWCVRSGKGSRRALRPRCFASDRVSCFREEFSICILLINKEGEGFPWIRSAEV